MRQTVKWEDVQDGSVVRTDDRSTIVKWNGRGITTRSFGKMNSPGCYDERYSWLWEEEDAYPEVEVLANIGDGVLDRNKVANVGGA